MASVPFGLGQNKDKERTMKFLEKVEDEGNNIVTLFYTLLGVLYILYNLNSFYSYCILARKVLLVSHKVSLFVEFSEANNLSEILKLLSDGARI